MKLNQKHPLKKMMMKIFKDSELPVVMSDPSAPRNESNNLTYHGHGVENKNDNNNINDDDDNDDDADDKKSIPSNLMP